jgi:hypothetical protein
MRKSADDFVVSSDNGISLVLWTTIAHFRSTASQGGYVGLSLFFRRVLVFSSAKRCSPYVQETTITFW